MRSFYQMKKRNTTTFDDASFEKKMMNSHHRLGWTKVASNAYKPHDQKHFSALNETKKLDQINQNAILFASRSGLPSDGWVVLTGYWSNSFNYWNDPNGIFELTLFLSFVWFRAFNHSRCQSGLPRRMYENHQEFFYLPNCLLVWLVGVV